MRCGTGLGRSPIVGRGPVVLQTFGSAGAGIFAGASDYRHSAPLEPGILRGLVTTNIRLRWSRENLVRLVTANIRLRWSRRVLNTSQIGQMKLDKGMKYFYGRPVGY